VRSHAVVIGGGVAGSLTAHALSEHFGQVSILERYRYPPPGEGRAPWPRRGVPQSRCPHLLMGAGVAAFDALTPGWRERVVAGGGVPFDAARDAASWVPSGWLPRYASGIQVYACSRALLERSLRDLLGDKPRVVVREGQRVVGLLGTPDGGRVTGVRVLGEDGTEHALSADLVVDAAGRQSSLPGWLTRLGDGVGPVMETEIPSGWQYVSRWYHIPPDRAPDWQCLSVAPGETAHGCSAMMLRAEADHWGLVLLASEGVPLPDTEASLRAFAGGIGDGALATALEPAETASPIHRYGITPSRWRHYESVPRWPDGLVALGDSACSLDPYYGLGMTASARAALLLGSHLEGADESGRGSYQRALAELNAEPWALVTGCDASGQSVDRDEARLGALYRAAPSDRSVAGALLAVQHLLRPLGSLRELQAT